MQSEQCNSSFIYFIIEALLALAIYISTQPTCCGDRKIIKDGLTNCCFYVVTFYLFLYDNLILLNLKMLCHTAILFILRRR